MSPFRSLTVEDFLARVGEKSPAPGGGAVACLAGAAAASIAKMVVEYSIGKKSLAGHRSVLERAAVTLAGLSGIFLELADEDAEAYGLVSELSRLPEDDPRRLAEMAGASAAAVAAPRAALAAAADLLQLVEQLVPITNRQLRSDLAIAGVLGEAAARSAWWNVAVNLALIPDLAEREQVEADGRALIGRAAVQRASIERGCE